MEPNPLDADIPKPWEVQKTERGPDLILFRARYDYVRNPRNDTTLKALILDAPDWVNVAALTPQGEFVVVRQYRFGVGRTTTEIPAGVIERGEAHQRAAARELEEETGYTSNEWTYLGHSEPNSAFLNNSCHHWLALNVQKTGIPQLDEGEHISVALMKQEEIKKEIAEGRFRNSLALLTVTKVFNIWDA